MRRLVACTAIIGGALVLAPGRAWAPPPISAFPSVILPAPGTTAPSNARIWVFGSNAPPVDRIGVELTIDGIVVPNQLAAVGCCAVTATLQNARPGTVSATVTGTRNAVHTTFTLTRSTDVTAPVLDSARLLDDSGGQLVIGASGTDEGGLAGYVARSGGTTVEGAVPPGLLLIVRPSGDRCVDVTAVDLVGQESAPRRVCGTVSTTDAGIADGGIVDGGGGGCATTRGDPSLFFLALLIRSTAGRRRPRRPAASTRTPSSTC